MARPWRGLLVFILSLHYAASALGSEEDFVFVNRMPAVQGELKGSYSLQGKVSGVAYAKKVFVLESRESSILSHTITVDCAMNAEDTPHSEYFIVAIQYLPKRPLSFNEATRNDYYQEVYVRDENEKIRLYRHLSGRDMVELTDRFRPFCPRL